MFTQCQHCQAIFRVSMREVTVSKGMLRCGECMQVFDSSKNISTSMQEPFKPLKNTNSKETNDFTSDLASESVQTIKSLDDWQTSPTNHSTPETSSQEHSNTTVSRRQNPSREAKYFRKSKTSPKKPIKEDKTSVKSKKKTTTKFNVSNINWPLAIACFLAILFGSQVAYNYRHVLLNSQKYEPEKIQMLNHNVFAHPIEKNVLLISASIKNIADFDQPYPVLEVKLTNAKAELVALRRFSPSEYLDNYSSSQLLIKNQATSIKLKIQDPGNQATRFQFNFM